MSFFRKILPYAGLLFSIIPIAPLVLPMVYGADEKVGLAIAGGILAFIGFFVLIIIALSAFWIWMLVDCAMRENFKQDSDKVIWILVLVFTHWIGALIYYLVIRRDLGNPKTGHKKSHPSHRR